MSSKKIPVVAVLGPTAAGKTDLAIRLAQRFDGEIVSCDSMQIYKGFDIATAKPTKDEQRLVPHHMIDFLSPDDSFSAAEYVKMAKPVVADIHLRGKAVILCGGTGLYADALLSGMLFSESAEEEQKKREISAYYQDHGLDALLERLKRADPSALSQIDCKNSKRVLRAVVICEAYGTSLAEYRAQNRAKQSPYHVLRFVLDVHDRAYLYRRIDLRVDKMATGGLLEEAESFYLSHIDGTASQIIGYKELIPFIEGRMPLSQALENLKRATRRYAKRQMTWFRKYPDAVRLYIDDDSFFPQAEDACRAFIERTEYDDSKNA